MEENVPPYLQLIKFGFNDKDTDNLIAHFRDKSKRKEFFKLYKEVEMLYEIISPDKFLRPYIDNYTTFSAIYQIVRNAYARRIQVDREFQRKTNELIQNKIGMSNLAQVNEFFEINEETIKKIQESQENDNTRVINLVKSIEKIAEKESDDPFLIGLQERAAQVEERYEDRQITTLEALAEIRKIYEDDIKRKKEQAETGFDGLTFFIYRTLLDKDFKKASEFKARVKEFAGKMDIKVKALAIRPMVNKWASCSTDGNLNFNKELLDMDKEIGDYVIVHELLHFNVPNHGKLWKSLMTAYLGDYEKIETKLNKGKLSLIE